MVQHLTGLFRDDSSWDEQATLGEWWLRLHAAMILGHIPGERAGMLLADFMRHMARAQDESLQDWLSGYWPALFRNKPEGVLPALRALAEDRTLDWYIRANAFDAILAEASRRHSEAFDVAIDWAAAMAADEQEDWEMRLSVGNTLLDLSPARHRPLLEDLARRQTGLGRSFSSDDVQRAYSGKKRPPEWERFNDPWAFYSPARIAQRQERWAKEDAEADESEGEPLLQPRATPKIGRNDPCPCGSGKKYKRCCLAVASGAAEPPADFAWRRLRRLLDQFQRDVLRFVKNVYGRGAIEEAWREFMSDEHAPFDPESTHLQVFMPWLFHFWSPDSMETKVRDAALHDVIPTEEYLRRKKRLDPQLRSYLESCIASPLTMFEILRSDPGRGLRLRDLFTREEREVTERSASVGMDEGDLVFGQVGEAGGVAILEACQGFVVPPIHKLEVIAFRQRRFPGEAAVAPQRLRDFDREMIELYHKIADQILERRMPALQNTDGEALSLRRVVFDVPSAQEAFGALRHLALDDSEADLLRDAARDGQGQLVRVNFTWLKRGNAANPGMDNTVLGSIEIDGTRLAVEVNSEKREKQLRAIVAEALGERARYRATEIRSLERMLAEAPASGAGARESADVSQLPEVKAKMAEIMAKHYEHWVNESIPALGGRTPLQAVADVDGREAVDALVTQIERDGERMKPPLDPAIVRRLRETLGLEVR